jgi:hypothetical protein
VDTLLAKLPFKYNDVGAVLMFAAAVIVVVAVAKKLPSLPIVGKLA